MILISQVRPGMGICGSRRSWVVIGVVHKDGKFQITYLSSAYVLRVKLYEHDVEWTPRGEALFS